MIQKATKKPVTIEFAQFNFGEDCQDVIDLLQKTPCDYRFDDEFLFISTLEGEMRADSGDYIIRGLKGECYPCKPDIFLLSYDIEESSFISRIHLEIQDLTDKITKLDEFIKTSPIFPHTSSEYQRLMLRQLHIMNEYKACLDSRLLYLT